VDNLILTFIGHIFENKLDLSFRLPSHGFIKLNNKFILGEINWDNLRNNKEINESKSLSVVKRLKNITKKVIRKMKNR
jgi:hypothetical protein